MVLVCIGGEGGIQKVFSLTVCPFYFLPTPLENKSRCMFSHATPEKMLWKFSIPWSWMAEVSEREGFGDQTKLKNNFILSKQTQLLLALSYKGTMPRLHLYPRKHSVAFQPQNKTAKWELAETVGLWPASPQGVKTFIWRSCWKIVYTYEPTSFSLSDIAENTGRLPICYHSSPQKGRCTGWRSQKAAAGTPCNSKSAPAPGPSQLSQKVAPFIFFKQENFMLSYPFLIYMQVLKDSLHLPRSSPDLKRKLLLETKIKFIIFAAIKRKSKSTSVLNRAWSKAGGSIWPSLVYSLIHLSIRLNHLLLAAGFPWVTTGNPRLPFIPHPMAYPCITLSDSAHTPPWLKSFTVFLLSFFLGVLQLTPRVHLGLISWHLSQVLLFSFKASICWASMWGKYSSCSLKSPDHYPPLFPLTSHQTLPPCAWHRADIQYFFIKLMIVICYRPLPTPHVQ